MQVASNANWRQDIAEILKENQLGEGQFIHEEVFPIVPVGAQTGRFHKIAFSEVQTGAVDDLGNGSAEANQVQHETTSDTYGTVLRKLKEFISDEDKARFDNVFDAEVAAADLCRYYIRSNREKRVADIVFDVATEMVDYNSAVTTAWSTAATATPVKDVETAKNALIDQVNGMVSGRARIIGVGHNSVRALLKATTDFKGRWTGGNTKSTMADLTDEQIAATLGLDAVYFSGLKQGGSNIWTNTQFGIYIVSDDPSLESVVRIGNTLLWRGGSEEDLMVKTWETEDPEGTWAFVKTHTDEKLYTARAGHVLTGVQS